MSAEFVALIPSSDDAPEKLIALVNALALEKRVQTSLTSMKAGNDDFKNRSDTDSSIVVEEADGA